MSSDPKDARDEQNPGPAPREPHRENVPGSLDHASGEVDKAEAAIVAGAGGEIADESVPGGARSEDDLEADEDGRGTSRHAVPGAPTTGTRGPRVLNFLRACWAELQRVQWPDRRQVGQATAVVIGFVIVAGLYLGVADWAAGELVDLIL